MIYQTMRKKGAAAMLLSAFALMLTGCVVTPGKFASTLVLNADNSFDFTYDGEIFFLPLAPGAMKDSKSDAEFSGGYCYDEESFEERECTEEELAEQRAEWEASQAENAKRDQERAEKMAMALGGVDPSDPEAGAKMARMLERQRGWNKVEYRGEGVFHVEYAIFGQLSHDLTFPVMEGLTLPNPFIQVVLRDEDVVRVNAPAFASQGANNPMGAFFAGAFGQGLSEAIAKDSEDGETGIPEMRGTFTLVTNGKILANNTDEGPNPTPTGEMLVWDISAQTTDAPTALIRLGR